MRHYEIVFLVHPDQSEQVAGMIGRGIASQIDRDAAEIFRLAPSARGHAWNNLIGKGWAVLRAFGHVSRYPAG